MYIFYEATIQAEASVSRNRRSYCTPAVSVLYYAGASGELGRTARLLVASHKALERVVLVHFPYP